MFEWCRKTNTRLLYASSSAVEEEYWENPYAMTKWINEVMAPPNSVGMRFTTVYGPDSRPNMMYRMLEDKTAKYVTNHKRDWIHVKDVCRAIHYLASSSITGPVTIGTGKSVSVKALADAMCHTGSSPRHHHTPHSDSAPQLWSIRGTPRPRWDLFCSKIRGPVSKSPQRFVYVFSDTEIDTNKKL